MSMISARSASLKRRTLTGTCVRLASFAAARAATSPRPRRGLSAAGTSRSRGTRTCSPSFGLAEPNNSSTPGSMARGVIGSPRSLRSCGRSRRGLPVDSRGIHDETLGQVLQHALRFRLRELGQVAGADGDRLGLGILRSLGGAQDLDVALVEGITLGGWLPWPAVAAPGLMPSAVVHAEGLGGVEAALAAFL